VGGAVWGVQRGEMDNRLNALKPIPPIAISHFGDIGNMPGEITCRRVDTDDIVKGGKMFCHH
jgi:hypothetical protein